MTWRSKCRPPLLEIFFTNDLGREEARGGDWKEDLLLDIRQECERQFGHIVHIDTDPNTAEVYVKFATIESGGKAVQGLNGRYFGGRMIAAAPIIEAVYNSHWSRAINL
jgi:RNA-binding protein 39